MQLEQPLSQEADPGLPTCAQCGKTGIDQHTPTPLCTDCRDAFIKFPIPLWIKGVGVVITALLILSLASLPRNISLAIHLERGKKAEKEKKYVTALKEFSFVLKALPGHAETKAHLCLASYYNMDYEQFARFGTELAGKTIEDEHLIHQVQQAFDTSDDYFLNDSLASFQKQFPAAGIPDKAYMNYLTKHPNDIFASYQYASRLYERKEYKACDSIASAIIEMNRDYTPAIMLLTSVKRLEDDAKSSLYYCDQLLAINKESVYGLSSKARTLLKMKEDKQALKLALASKAIDANDGYNLATLALVYHYNNQQDKRDQVIEQVNSSNDSSQRYYLQTALDIISHKEKFRD